MYAHTALLYHTADTHSGLPVRTMSRHAYEPVIGLEVHCQLQTWSKAFSADSAAFGAQPNRHVDPISLGHPGTLPVLNRRVVEFAIRMGLATHCQIAERSILARKHYFYPDLPKGYQISQYEAPLCVNGYVAITSRGETGERRIGITRIHIEEDAGKSIHDQDPSDSLLDFNRCGVPLIEIVSEPDLRSAHEAYLYMHKIRQLVRYLGICDGNMEEGSLRCDANVSVRPRGDSRLGVKTEIKNMNSFRNVERAIDHEISRQIRRKTEGSDIDHQTMLWDAGRQETRIMRTKEEAHDYRYFPDPDLPPIVVTAERLATIREALPELPDARRQRFMRTLALPAYDAALLTEERQLADYFESALAALHALDANGELALKAKLLSNLVMTDVLRTLNERGQSMDAFPIEADRLAGLALLRHKDQASSSGAQEIFNKMLDDPRSALEIAEAHQLLQVSDEGALLPVVEQVLSRHADKVDTYLSGKHSLIGFFIGQVMRSYDGSPNPKLVRSLLEKTLAARRD